MENYSEKIQDYIEGQLEGEDLIQFEAQLLVDDELRNLLSLQKEVHDILSHRVVSKEIELRETLSTVSNNFRHQTAVKVVNFRKWIPILAAACLLVVGALFFFNQSDDLYALPELHSEIVRGQEENVVYENGVKAFNAKDYSVARLQFESLISSNPTQAQYQYYLGLTFLGEENLKSSIEILLPIASGESVFANEAKYYLAIAYHKNSENNKAIELLDQIKTDTSLSEKANRLLNKIN